MVQNTATTATNTTAADAPVIPVTTNTTTEDLAKRLIGKDASRFSLRALTPEEIDSLLRPAAAGPNEEPQAPWTIEQIAMATDKFHKQVHSIIVERYPGSPMPTLTRYYDRLRSEILDPVRLELELRYKKALYGNSRTAKRALETHLRSQMRAQMERLSTGELSNAIKATERKVSERRYSQSKLQAVTARIAKGKELLEAKKTADKRKLDDIDTSSCTGSPLGGTPKKRTASTAGPSRRKGAKTPKPNVGESLTTDKSSSPGPFLSALPNTPGLSTGLRKLKVGSVASVASFSSFSSFSSVPSDSGSEA